MIFKDYYRILELQNSKATIDQIKTAYREQAKKYHPDKNINNKIYEERFKDIAEAYKTLSNPMERKKYDKMWNINVGNKKRATAKTEELEKDTATNEFINMFFGERTTETQKKVKIPIKGENIETQIDVGIADAFYGNEKKISLRTVSGDYRTFNVKIPAGIRNGEKIRLIGQGKTGINGARNGDLFIKINILDSEKLKLQYCDLYTNLYLAPWEAALGTKVKVKGLDETLTIFIPQGTGSGEKIKIEGKGYKDGKGGRGDLVAEVKVMVPKELTAEERNLFQQLSEKSSFEPRQ